MMNRLDERMKSGSPCVERHTKEEKVEGHEVFLSREVIIGYLAEILILQAEGGASKCAKDDGG